MARVPKGRGALSAARVGEWGKAGRVLRGLVNTVPQASAIVRAQAELSQARLVNNIKRQIYPWPKLAPETVKEKARKNQDPRILIAEGDYIDAIKVLPMGPLLWAVGIEKGAKNRDGRSLVMIGLSHEYGMGGNPPRPHWRREYTVFRAQTSAALNALLAQKVSLRR